MTTNTTSTDAREFEGLVYERANASTGANRDGQNVIRIAAATTGAYAMTTTLILTPEAADALLNELDVALRQHARDELVDPEDACPDCGEQRQDKLVWTNQSSALRCENCGRVYTPHYR